MIQELLYTSAPRGLKAGSRGFCTVLSTQGMPAPLAVALEGLSGYRPVYPPGSEDAARNPVVHSHLLLPVGGRRTSILSRTADYGLDYSQRTNKISHHLVLEPADRVDAGPARLLLTPGVMRTEWDGEPRVIPPGRNIQTPRVSPTVCRAWEQATGDAGWAGVLAEAFLRDPARLAYLLFEPGTDPLPLIAEALDLLPAERRWDVTFSTYFTGLVRGATCNWRCVLSDSPEANQSRRHPQALRIDLTRPMGTAEGGELVEFARTGVRPAAPVAPKVTAVAARDESSRVRQADGSFRLSPAPAQPPAIRPALPEARSSRRRTVVRSGLISMVLMSCLFGGLLIYQRQNPSDDDQEAAALAQTDSDVPAEATPETSQAARDPEPAPVAEQPKAASANNETARASEPAPAPHSGMSAAGGSEMAAVVGTSSSASQAQAQATGAAAESSGKETEDAPSEQGDPAPEKKSQIQVQYVHLSNPSGRPGDDGLREVAKLPFKVGEETAPALYVPAKWEVSDKPSANALRISRDQDDPASWKLGLWEETTGGPDEQVLVEFHLVQEDGNGAPVLKFKWGQHSGGKRDIVRWCVLSFTDPETRDELRLVLHSAAERDGKAAGKPMAAWKLAQVGQDLGNLSPPPLIIHSPPVLRVGEERLELIPVVEPSKGQISKGTLPVTLDRKHKLIAFSLDRLKGLTHFKPPQDPASMPFTEVSANKKVDANEQRILAVTQLNTGAFEQYLRDGFVEARGKMKPDELQPQITKGELELHPSFVTGSNFDELRSRFEKAVKKIQGNSAQSKKDLEESRALMDQLISEGETVHSLLNDLRNAKPEELNAGYEVKGPDGEGIISLISPEDSEADAEQTNQGQ